MELRQALICTILHEFNGERSIYGALHLLKGKKSAQTIQDGAFFNLLPYFGLFPTLTRQELEKEVDILIQTGQAVVGETDKVSLTKHGILELQQFHEKHRFLKDLQAWKYNASTEIVWLRICLFIQTITNVAAGIKGFYPITHHTDIQTWVKQQLVLETDRTNKLAQISKQLTEFLSECTEVQALIFVHQLSGVKQIGLTRQQLSEHLKLSLEEVRIYHIATLHRLFAKLEEEPISFSDLIFFMEGQRQELILTESARQTFTLLKEGHTIGSICEKRKLKKSTVEDHIVELAIQHPQFSIRPFVTTEMEEEIMYWANTLHTSRLREIKEKVTNEISYFMIRLVLARKKVKNET